MTTSQQAAAYLRQTGEYKVLKTPLADHIDWSVIPLPLQKPHHFATLYSNQTLIDLAVTLGFSTSWGG